MKKLTAGLKLRQGNILYLPAEERGAVALQLLKRCHRIRVSS